MASPTGLSTPGASSTGASTRIGLLPGDPAGIGPEIVAKVLARLHGTPGIEFVAIGTAETLRAGAQVAGIAPDAVPMIGIDTSGVGPIRTGEPTRAAGLFMLRSMQVAADAVRAGEIDAIVYAPLNKQAMKLGGFADVDEMHYFAALFGVRGFFSELNQLDEMWTARVTSHVPLREVPALITRDRVMAATRLAVETMRQAGIGRPRIAVVGLNPHAGDGGTIGQEEIDVIAPAIAALRAEGHDVHGPASPDTIFATAARAGYNLVVTMYHDQGQVALKTLGFERVVTVLGGLPVPAATASAGSAYDIAGRNVASPEALIRACLLVRRMAEARRTARAAPIPAQ